MNLKISDAIGIFLLICFMLIGIKSCDRKKNEQALITALQDSLVKYVNKEGEHIATRMTLNTRIETLESIVAGKDSLLKEIQDKATKNTASFTAFTTKTTNEHTSPTTTTNQRKFSETDEGNGDSLRTALQGISPDHLSTTSSDMEVCDGIVYESSYKDESINYYIRSGKDSTYAQFVTYNQFNVEQHWEKPGKGLKAFFQSSVLKTDITNKNKHTETLDMQSYYQSQPEGRGWRIFGFGVAIGGTVIYLLVK